MQVKCFQTGVMPTNTYVLSEGGFCVVIDPAFGCRQVAAHIAERRLVLKAILLTHGHFDHCGGVETLLKLHNAPVFVCRNDLELCTHAQSNRWGVRCDNCNPTNFFQEGRLQIEPFTFDILFTAGHTAGSVVILCGNIMFSGDTLFCGGVGRTDFPESQPEEMGKSLQKLCRLAQDYTVLAGHGEPTTLAYEKIYNPYLL